MYSMVFTNEDSLNKMRYVVEEKNRRIIESLYVNIVDDLINDVDVRRHVMEDYKPVKNLDCHDEVVQAFTSICVNWNKFDYALKYSNVLNNLCIQLDDAVSIISAMKKICSKTNSRFL
ncbi:hypothetical protein OESDEN_06492 [Oesophagostomum dentatum]|uniref:Legumain prodomain domain-containing protein n=1 Tax=Oesophagostomum dentatum TaxID=61180 RepID=A0A0B1TBU9_OESDE|nr:hypothetical protein OESDEN_06492 [Oesophagostomum dentatum]